MFDFFPYIYFRDILFGTIRYSTIIQYKLYGSIPTSRPAKNKPARLPPKNMFYSGEHESTLLEMNLYATV